MSGKKISTIPLTFEEQNALVNFAGYVCRKASSKLAVIKKCSGGDQ